MRDIVHLMRPEADGSESYWTYCGIEGPSDHIQTTEVTDKGRTTCKKCKRFGGVE